jgi:hypothetical protein
MAPRRKIDTLTIMCVRILLVSLLFAFPRSQTALTDAQGTAMFPPAGQYVIAVNAPGFDPTTRTIVVSSNAVTPVTLQLRVAGLEPSVVVAAAVQSVNPESWRTETPVQRSDIAREPDADRSGSLAMITSVLSGSLGPPMY